MNAHFSQSTIRRQENSLDAMEIATLMAEVAYMAYI